jgi:Protein of unknown function, DUF547
MGLGDLKRSLLDAADVLRHTTGRGLVRAVGGAKRRVLNEAAGETSPRDAAEVAQRLRALGRRMEGEALDDRGRVDYAAMRRSEQRAAFEATAWELASVDPSALEGDAARVAFWLNVYNVLSIHGVVALGIERSVMEDPTFFGSVAYRVGKRDYTLDEIENGVLRRNRAHPVAGKPLWGADDARLASCPTEVDARIHAALVCASASCPAVRFYDADELEAQLDAATRAYVRSEVRVDHEARRIVLPITFRYYAEDFAQGALAFVRDYADEALAGDLSRAQAYEVDHARYDWSLNAK